MSLGSQRICVNTICWFCMYVHAQAVMLNRPTGEWPGNEAICYMHGSHVTSVHRGLE